MIKLIINMIIIYLGVEFIRFALHLNHQSNFAYSDEIVGGVFIGIISYIIYLIIVKNKAGRSK